MNVIEDTNHLDEKSTVVGRVNTRSDVAMEVISYRLNFFEKWGITLFALIFLTLLGLSYFFEYPDTIEGVAYLSSANAPKPIIINQSGRLIKMIGKNNDIVKRSAIIAWVESPGRARHDEIINLYEQVNLVVNRTKNNDDDKVFLMGNTFLNLGEIQYDYQLLLTNIEIFNDYKKGFYSQRKSKLREDVAALGEISNNIESQEKIVVENNSLSKESFKMNEELYKKGVITADEYRQQKSKMLNNLLQIPTVKSNIIENKQQTRDKQTDIKSLEYTALQQKRLVIQGLFDLKSKLENWISQYCVVAPIDGQLYFDSQAQEYQFLKGGENIGYVLPQNKVLYAEIFLPQQNIGKIEPSMEVQLRFEAYPYQEFGSVIGKLVHISDVAGEKGFAGVVELKDGLSTNQHITIKYREGLQSRAIVITKNMNMLTRMWHGLVKHIDVNKKQ